MRRNSTIKIYLLRWSIETAFDILEVTVQNSDQSTISRRSNYSCGWPNKQRTKTVENYWIILNNEFNDIISKNKKRSDVLIWFLDYSILLGLFPSIHELFILIHKSRKCLHPAINGHSSIRNWCNIGKMVCKEIVSESKKILKDAPCYSFITTDGTILLKTTTFWGLWIGRGGECQFIWINARGISCRERKEGG